MTTAEDINDKARQLLSGAGPAVSAAWSAFISGDSFKPSTRAAYRSVALTFMRWLESQEIALSLVTPLVVERFLGAQHLAPASKRQYCSALRRFFDALVAHGVLP